MSKPRINTDESVAGSLFSELGKNNDDEEMERIAREHRHRV